MEAVKKVEKLASSDRVENARVRWNRGRALLFLGDVKASLEDHEEALRVFEEEYSLPDLAYILPGTGVTRASLDSFQFDKALTEVMLGTVMCLALGYAQAEANQINVLLAEHFYAIGLFQEALSNYANALQISERIGDFDNIAYALGKMGELLAVVSGNCAEGMPQLLKAWRNNQN